MYNKLVDGGFSATRYHSQLPHAEFELAKFTELDHANICVSVGSLTKGFDYPPTDMIVLMRATTSLPLYLQMLGRGSRPTPGKSNFQVLDYGENWKRHGLYWEDRSWDKLWKQTKKSKSKGIGVSTAAFCPSCEAIISASLKTCPYCNHVRPATPQEVVPPLSIYIPNAFTPNGDGINDGFQVKGEGIRDFHIYIYNHWGEVIFESTNPKQAWDGTFQGRPVEMETYVYQIFADGLGKKSRTGSVTLIR